MQRDRRDFGRELLEEILDALFYGAAALLRAPGGDLDGGREGMETDKLRSRARALRDTGPAAEPGRPAPEESGVRVATIARGTHEELRVNLTEWHGRRLVNLRVWLLNRQGQWLPDKRRGLTIRLDELADFADGIAAAVDIVRAEQHAAGASGA